MPKFNTKFSTEIMDDSFSFIIDDLKVELTMPQIDTDNSKRELKDASDIEYFSYIVNVYTRNYNILTEKFDFEKQFEIDVIDFPGVISLSAAIKNILNKKEDDSFQTIKLPDNELAKSFTYSNEASLCEDIYKITKTYRTGMDPFYILQIGKDEGAFTKYISTQTLPEGAVAMIDMLLDDFLKYSIGKYNDKMTEKYNWEAVNKRTLDKVLVIDTSNGKSFQIIGDFLSDFDYIKDGNVKSFPNCTLSEIGKDSITVQKGNSKKTVDLKNVFYVWHDVDMTPRLEYGVSEIIEDFKRNIFPCSEKVKKDFEEKDLDYLVKEYTNVFIDRYWMCRDEHPYMNESVTDRVEYVTKIVKDEIIPSLQGKILDKDNPFLGD